ncbi:AAA family ATPase [Helicobacter baculiformis]|uniref:AAA family ATPase n=1 Tax=Helicobacter baculiformis TaxID=427351 RepID=A0ABV7ZJL3_9HELI|nr:AAA family ATPase [Helicobacter baculiformis]
MYLGKELEAFIREFHLSQAQVARSIGRSPALLSKYLKGQYEVKDVSALEASIKDFMHAHRHQAQERVKLQKSPLKELENYKNAHFFIDQAVVCEEMCLLYGEAGSGKSASLKAYAQKSPQCVLLEVIPGLNDKDFLRGLCEHMGVQSAPSVAQTILNLVKNIQARQAILLIDEAEHLKTASLEALRRLHDFTQMPIVLVGTPQLLKNLRGKHGELLQLYSRISLKYAFSAPSKADFSLLFGQHASQIAAITTNLRRACKIYKMAQRFHQIDATPLEEAINIVASMSILD